MLLFSHSLIQQETKRSGFPRFYFLSNDELLAILSQTREPQSVQPHLRKCFDAIAELGFEGSHGIVSMKSAENEVVPFTEVLYAEGNVEDWLTAVESSMRKTLHNLLQDAWQAFSHSHVPSIFSQLLPSRCADMLKSLVKSGSSSTLLRLCWLWIKSCGLRKSLRHCLPWR